MRSLLKVTLLAALFFNPMLVCFAKTPKTYRVEVLIFETKDKGALAQEWPLEPGKPASHHATALVSDPKSEYGELPSNEFALLDAKQKIQKNYRLVLHKGWRQTIVDKDQAQPVHIVGGKNYGGETPQFEVDGTLLLTGGRQIRVDTDLIFNKPMKNLSMEPNATTARFSDVTDKNHWQNQPDVKVQSFRMKEASRLKVDEIQYIDHPLYGVIVMVTPEKGAS